MIINACVQKEADIDVVAQRIKEATTFNVQILRNLRILIISGPDSASQQTVLERIRETSGIEVASIDCKTQLIQ